MRPVNPEEMHAVEILVRDAVAAISREHGVAFGAHYVVIGPAVTRMKAPADLRASSRFCTSQLVEYAAFVVTGELQGASHYMNLGLINRHPCRA